MSRTVVTRLGFLAGVGLVALAAAAAPADRPVADAQGAAVTTAATPAGSTPTAGPSTTAPGRPMPAATRSRAGVVGAEPVDLVTASPPAAEPGVPRPIEVDETVLVPGRDVAVRLRLGAGNAPTAKLRAASAVRGHHHWTGQLAGVPGSMVTMVRRGADVTGVVSGPEGTYTITTSADGGQLLTAADPEAPDGDLVLDPKAPAGDQGTAPDASTGAAPADTGTASADGGPVVDVLVAYTPQAATAAGGVPAIESLAATAVAVTNDSFAASGANLSLNLVGTLQISGTATDASSATLNQLTARTDGSYDAIHAARDAAGADLVSLLVEGGPYCGIAWYPGSASYGFSVVDQGCAVGNLTFPHELGHNFGAAHDRYVDPDGYYPYGHGRVNLSGRWRTIMAYNDQCAAAGFYCSRIARWSNADQTYLSSPLGIPVGQPDAADNRTALNSMAATVASYRPSAAPPVAPSAPHSVTATADWNTAAVTWQAPAEPGSGVTSYTVTSDPPGWSATVGGSTTSATATGLSDGVTYRFSVTATGPGGTSPASALSDAVTWQTDLTDPTLALTGPATGYTLSTDLTVTWSAADDVAGVAGVDVRTQRAPYNAGFGAYAYPASWQGVTGTELTLTGAGRGSTYCFSARGRDNAGNVTAWSAPRCVTVALDDRSMVRSSGWALVNHSAYYAGTATVTGRLGATVTRTNVQTKRIYLVATRCPTCGTVGVYWNGSLLKRISLYAPVTTPQSVLGVTSLSAVRSGTVTVRVLTSGKPVRIDGLALPRS